MKFEADKTKAHQNLRDHKVPFVKASEVFKDHSRLERPDASRDYDEERLIVIGRVEQTVLLVVFTQRGERLRLISARKANRNEQRTYWTGDIYA
jgi:uncharacterized DUF497 family protein